jgi:hypothetical protein
LALVAPALVVMGCAIVFAGAACGSNGGGFGGTPNGGGNGADATTGFDQDGGDLQAESLAIEPADSVVTVTNLTTPATATLTARATFADKSVRTVTASWTLDRLDIAGVGAGTGVATSTNLVFGKCEVTATAAGATAKTSLIFKLAAAIDNGVSGGDQALLSAATATDPGVTKVAYPYDATVFPKGLLPPEIMWNGGAAGDSYLLKLTGPNFDLTIFTTADPPSRFTATQKVWDSFTSSVAGNDVNVELRRLSGGTAYVSAKEKWTIADANLRGTIYYWAINQGQIIKLDLATGQTGPVFDSGPSTQMQTPAPANAGNPRNPPWEDNSAGKRCVACHAVSKDGSTLTSIFTRQDSLGPAGYVSLASAQVRSVGDYEQNGIFTALTPDGALGVLNTNEKRMNLIDSATGLAVASSLDSLTDVCDPAFSPDGTMLALATTCDPGVGYPVEFRTSNLSIFDFAQTTRSFTNLRTIVPSAGDGDTKAIPSFSPESK